jgi:predicted peroxiredoxin
MTENGKKLVLMVTQQELVQGATIVGAATFVAECAAATNVLVY